MSGSEASARPVEADPLRAAILAFMAGREPTRTLAIANATAPDDLPEDPFMGRLAHDDRVELELKRLAWEGVLTTRDTRESRRGPWCRTWVLSSMVPPFQPRKKAKSRAAEDPQKEIVRLRAALRACRAVIVGDAIRALAELPAHPDRDDLGAPLVEREAVRKMLADLAPGAAR